MIGYKLGASLEGLTSVENLGLLVPRAEPVHYSVYQELGSGGVRGAGWLTTTWRFDFLSIAQVNTLRGYCPGTSAAVYITTRDDTDLSNGAHFGNYSAIVVWPQLSRPKGGFFFDFVLEFRKLVAA